jgi:hypothetical protein
VNKDISHNLWRLSDSRYDLDDLLSLLRIAISESLAKLGHRSLAERHDLNLCLPLK